MRSNPQRIPNCLPLPTTANSKRTIEIANMRKIGTFVRLTKTDRLLSVIWLSKGRSPQRGKMINLIWCTDGRKSTGMLRIWFPSWSMVYKYKRKVVKRKRWYQMQILTVDFKWRQKLCIIKIRKFIHKVNHWFISQEWISRRNGIPVMLRSDFAIFWKALIMFIITCICFSKLTKGLFYASLITIAFFFLIKRG